MSKPKILAPLLVFSILLSLQWTRNCRPVLGSDALRLGFVDPVAPGDPGPRNTAALDYARSQGTVTRLKPTPAGGWEAPGDRVHAPEEFDVIWYHQGDRTDLSLGEACQADLLAYLEGGGVLLLSGAAGSLVSELGIEPTPPRVLGPTSVAFRSGLVVPPNRRGHPIFSGLDTSAPLLLTSLGGNALADFYGTDGPHGELLAEGNAGLGERPLVEYTVGSGRVVFVGWRLPDFTTATDPYRTNLERLFSNILHYLSDRNTNRATLAVPEGTATYSRLLGVPFLRAERPVSLKASAVRGKAAVVLSSVKVSGDSLPCGSDFLTETPLGGEDATASASLGLTVVSRNHPASQYVSARRAEQEQADKRDQTIRAGLTLVTPAVEFEKAPLPPLQRVEPEQSVLLGRSPFMAPGDGKGAVSPIYQPLEDGGFSISGSSRRVNRPIVHGQNRVWTGDVPFFMMDTVTGNGTYVEERVFPLWPRPDAHIGNVNPRMGALRLGVRTSEDKTLWLDEVECETVFRPGYTTYWLRDPGRKWSASITVAPLHDSHGLVGRVEFSKPQSLIWQYGGIWWEAAEANKNQIAIKDLGLGRSAAFITEPNLPNSLVVAGCDGEGELRAIPADYGMQAEFVGKPRRVVHLLATWGVTEYDQDKAAKCLARLDTPNAAAWPAARDRMKSQWLDCHIGRALEPERRFRELMKGPEAALRKTQRWWDRRRSEFQIRTPDPHLNALVNWSRCVTDYHRQGPGLVLGGQVWQMYSHISTGWYGKEWGGDHDTCADNLRFYAAMQGDDGFVRWIAPSLVAFNAENNTPYWVDQVWRHYTWTGDTQFVREMWPAVRKSVAWMRTHNDPDGDGLFRDSYEYWNCDSNGKGPKSVVPSAMSWAMLDRAARMATVVGDGKASVEYRTLADKTQEAIFRELWREDKGRLGCVGADGLWRGHPQTWEEYLPINAGLLSADQGRSAMRWLSAHYGFQPQPGVRLLACSDWFPIRWSTQWVPTGDTCLATLAGMKCGDPDLWWPYLKTVALSSFQSDFPGINMGVSNAGAGGGDREDVDSVDPHVHAAVRGLFGIEPALHQGVLEICPAFPSNWRHASLRTPDVSYEYQRTGDKAVFRIQTPRPVVKRVRANLTGRQVVTRKERDSVVEVKLGPPPPPTGVTTETPILLEQATARGDLAPAGLTPEDRDRQVLFDLTDAFNLTTEGFSALQFVYDYADGPSSLSGWWGNPGLSMPPAPKMVETQSGRRFLTAGRPRPGVAPPAKNVLALSSWRPYPLPAACTISVGVRCRQLQLLLQSYVHPMKNYVPNGEVVLQYADGSRSIESLIPPYNLDCYFQHFSLRGESVPSGRLQMPGGWGFVPQVLCEAHADALALRCDPTKVLQSVQLRATCSEGVIGVVGMTIVAAAGGD